MNGRELLSAQVIINPYKQTVVVVAAAAALYEQHTHTIQLTIVLCACCRALKVSSCGAALFHVLRTSVLARVFKHGVKVFLSEILYTNTMYNVHMCDALNNVSTKQLNSEHMQY